MTQQQVKIKTIDRITHDVLKIVTEKPSNFIFTSGQASAISISKKGWENEVRPFTFTSIPSDSFLELIIKVYPSHNGVTNEFQKLKIGEKLILHNIFGSITYKGEGVFIAGGAGITPFISIFRNLHYENEIGNNILIFANKSKGDIIIEKELFKLLGKNLFIILSEEKTTEYEYGLITKDILEMHIKSSTQNVYVCGPPPMMESVEKHLNYLHVDKKAIIKEEF